MNVIVLLAEQGVGRDCLVVCCQNDRDRDRHSHRDRDRDGNCDLATLRADLLHLSLLSAPAIVVGPKKIHIM